MAQLAVAIENAIRLRLPKGSQVTVVNDSAVDVYYDFNREPLDAAVPGTAPTNGIKLAATTGSVQFFPFPGEIWFRSATPTLIKYFEG